MSKSRLEKFLYALYSLDSSDLPNPLSRIEELYKCLVTGDEAPTFEPISRVEKYLMAILGVYDVNSLPNPLSRVEVLLHKLATGDDNLDDVESFLSEYEELLAEIIRNGGVGENIDIEYVLYTLSTEFNTLYNTAEKPVKSAMLKGNTLVNGFNNSHFTPISISFDTNTPRTAYVEVNGNINTGVIGVKVYGKYSSILKLQAEAKSTVIKGGLTHVNGIFKIDCGGNTLIRLMFYVSSHDFISGCNELINNIAIFEYQDGMENWDIPYFEGMKSVQMPVLTSSGKNLFNVELEQGSINSNSGTLIETMSAIRSKDFIKLSSNETFTISKSNGTRIITVAIYDKNYKFVRALWEQTFTLTGDEMYVKIADVENDLNNQYQIEKGKTPSSYEPHKSNILTTNEEVELRKVGDVQDELNLLTGELSQRIGEIVLDGSDDLVYNHEAYSNDTTTLIHIPIPNTDKIFNFYNDKLAHKFVYENTCVDEGIFADWNGLYIRLLNAKLSSPNSDGVKEYFQSNHITVQYQLATPTIKTVDLSVVDQDGNNTKLSTFDDITHVTLSSEGLIPEAELEVATKNEEDLEDSSVYATHTLSEEFNTLYNTAEKPIKSAILKGQTLVNYAQITSHNFDENRTPIQNLNKSLEKGKSYTIIMNIVSQTTTTGVTTRFSKNNAEFTGIKTFSGVGLHKYLFTATTDFNQFAPYIDNDEYQTGLRAEYNHLMILEGDYTSVDIPFFEGMPSVKMPVLTTSNGGNVINNDMWMVGRLDSTTGGILSGNQMITDFIKKPYNVVEFSTIGGSVYNVIFEYDANKNFIKATGRATNSLVLTLASNTEFIKLNIQNPIGSLETHQPMLTSGGRNELKSNILSTSEDVTLRGIGNVRDELDLLTGEVAQNIGEIVLNGSESWREYASQELTNTRLFYCGVPTNSNINTSKPTIINNRFASLNPNSGGLWSNDVVGFGHLVVNNAFRLRVLKSTANTINELKEYLHSNPIVVQYELAEKSIKTVDLSVVNQDGNNTKLSTFDDITHVTLSSEGLIPEAELEVAEKVPEVAASMLSISREQEVINTATNEQSENVDSTMIATTEIYEELL